MVITPVHAKGTFVVAITRSRYAYLHRNRIDVYAMLPFIHPIMAEYLDGGKYCVE
jgi:hypothetical protein